MVNGPWESTEYRDNRKRVSNCRLHLNASDVIPNRYQSIAYPFNSHMLPSKIEGLSEISQRYQGVKKKQWTHLGLLRSIPRNQSLEPLIQMCQFSDKTTNKAHTVPICC